MTTALTFCYAMLPIASAENVQSRTTDIESESNLDSSAERDRSPHSPIMRTGVPAEFLDLIEPELDVSVGALIVDVYIDGVNRASTILEPLNESYILSAPEDILEALDGLSDSDSF